MKSLVNFICYLIVIEYTSLRFKFIIPIHLNLTNLLIVLNLTILPSTQHVFTLKEHHHVYLKIYLNCCI